MAKKKKIGKWWYSDFRHNHKRIRERLSQNEIQAEQMFQDLLKIRKSEKDGTQPKSVSWFYFCKSVLQWYKENRDLKTWYTILNAIETVERYGRPISQLSDMSPKYMENFLSRWKKLKFKRETALSHLRRLKTAIKWAEARDMVPTRTWTLIEMTPYAARVEYFEYEELYRLFDTCNGYWKTAAMLMAYAGLRSGEVRHLEWTDIDFKNRYIHVRAKFVELPGGKKIWWEPKESEPDKPNNRKVDFGDRLEAHLRSLPNQNGFVLGKYVKMNTYRQFFGRLTKQLKFKVYAHKFRHTYASFLISAGRSLEEVQALMGHKDIRSTQIYSHLMPHARRKAVDALEASLPPIPGPKFEVLTAHV